MHDLVGRRWRVVDAGARRPGQTDPPVAAAGIDSSLRHVPTAVAVAGGAIGMFVWYGFFIVIGELYFNMWQTELGLGSVGGAFRYGTVCAALTLFIALREE